MVRIILEFGEEDRPLAKEVLGRMSWLIGEAKKATQTPSPKTEPARRPGPVMPQMEEELPPAVELPPATVKPKGQAKKPRGWTPERLGELKDLLAAGLNDREVGERLGCSGSTIFLKRRALGLVANGEPWGGRKKSPKAPPQQERERVSLKRNEPEPAQKEGEESADLPTQELQEFRASQLDGMDLSDPNLSIRQRVALWLLDNPERAKGTAEQVMELYGQFCDLKPKQVESAYKGLRLLGAGMWRKVALGEA